MNEMKNGKLCVNTTHATIHANNMTWQYRYTIYMYIQFNTLATAILAFYTIHINLYYITYYTTHTSCIWHDT